MVVRHTIILVLVLNFFTCFIARLLQGGCFTYNKRTFPNYNGKNILIAGLLSQPEMAYQRISLPYCYSAFLRYSMLGFNPKNASLQVCDIARSRDCILGVSVGCKPIVFAGEPGLKRVLINPCTHAKGIIKKYRVLLGFLAPIFKLFCYMIGWIAVIPIIKIGENERYSLALLSDQLFWSYYGEPSDGETDYQNGTGIVLSKNDDYLANDKISKIYLNAEKIVVPTEHANIDNEYDSYLYDEAINNLLAPL